MPWWDNLTQVQLDAAGSTEGLKTDMAQLDGSLRRIDVDLTERSVNVKSFGAKGDGKTDDSDAFAKALQSCNNNKHSLYVPSGVYIIRKEIDVTNLDRIHINGPNLEVGQYAYPFETYCNAVIKTFATNVFTHTLQGIKTIKVGLQNIAFMNGSYNNGGVEVSLFHRMNLRGALIRECGFGFYHYWLYGGISYVSHISENTFYNVLKSVIYGRFDASCTITDSWITENYINASPDKTDVIFFDVHYPNMSNISHNFMDFAHTAINFTGGRSVQISNNIIDYCFVGVSLAQASGYSLVSNTFAHCGLAAALLKKYWKVPFPDAMSTTEWRGIALKNQVSDTRVIGSIGDQDTTVLISMMSYGYKNIQTSGNSITGNLDPNRVIKLNIHYADVVADEGKGLDLSELNHVKLDTLPSPLLTGTNRKSFNGQRIYYQNKLLRNDSGKWVDMLGNEVTA